MRADVRKELVRESGGMPGRPRVPELVPLIVAVYERHAAGCCLHVVTDDGNWDSVDFVLGYARTEGHPRCIAAAEMMSKMTESQVARATKRAREERSA